MALEFVQTLHQAHNEIRNALDKQKEGQVLELLELCQQGAIALGNFIEQAQGNDEEIPVIALIENYCEDTYQFYEKIYSKESLNSKKIYKVLRKQMIQIENEIKDKIKERLEAVFLPYKASMWDSLESVWRAADEDPDCDAYVIPIPYYDKNPDGSFRERHWEGDQYPKDVPIVNYEKYDFESRHPDVIFIHNPYDGCNYVTSIHPFFYSENLKKFTDKLMYIPYFILGKVSVEDQSVVESIEHFCTVPGVMNANKVIVESDEMRKIYIQNIVKHTGENTRSYWEEKILGLGSPKIDKVLNTRKEDLKIPEKWIKIIRKSDGNWKGIILYNTSIGALLEQNEQMLKKIENVLRVFKDNKEKAALLWRPHPLIKATIESMRPDLWREYQKIVERYKRGDWGIYDDTADVDRALCLADGMLSDPSSLVTLFQAAGKAVLLSEMDIAFESICFDGRNYWFVGYETNGLYKADINFDHVEFEAMIEGEAIFSFRLFREVVYSNRLLYFVPYSVNYFLIYDVLSKNFERIKIDEKVMACQRYLAEEYKFSGAFDCEDKIIFVPCAQPSFAVMEKETCKIHYLDSYFNELKELITEPEDILFYNPVMVGNYIFVSSCCANAVVSFDTVTENIKVYEVGKSSYRYCGICFDGEKFWLPPRVISKEQPVISWEMDSNRFILEEMPHLNLGKIGNFAFVNPLYINGKVYIFPILAHQGLVYDVENGKVSPFDFSVADTKIETNVKNSFAYYDAKEQKILSYDHCSRKFIIYALKTGVKNSKKILASQEVLIKGLIEVVNGQTDNGKKDSYSTESAGSRIYSHIKSNWYVN